MPVIVMANGKGGVGKSTGALVMAQELATKVPVTVIDADPNQPHVNWFSEGHAPRNLTVLNNETETSVLDEIDAATERSRFVIVDLEGVFSRRVTYAISRADLVLVPLQKQTLDGDMAAKVVKEIHNEARMQKRPIPYALAFTKTRVVAQSRTARLIESDVRKNDRIDVIDVELHERDAFAAMWTYGRVLRDLDRSLVNNVPAAIENARGFTQAVVNRFKQNNQKRNAA